MAQDAEGEKRWKYTGNGAAPRRVGRARGRAGEAALGARRAGDAGDGAAQGHPARARRAREQAQGAQVTDPKGKAVRERARAATVALPKVGSQGVLVPGGFVLTAAHCVTWYTTGAWRWATTASSPCGMRSGKIFRMEVFAVEPVSDIAVLGSADEQALSEDAEAFEAFSNETHPVPVRDDDFKLDAAVDVYVLTHRDTWVAARASHHGSFGIGGAVWLRAEADIEGGTSGGPVID